MADALSAIKSPLSQPDSNAKPLIGQAASVHLDFIRGLAALLVFINHIRDFSYVEYSQVLHKSAAIKIVYAVSGLGHDAVVVFFVLSGYFISNSIYRARAEGRWSWIWYAEQRLTRLYAVLLPALLLGAILDIIGMRLTGIGGIYGANPHSHGYFYSPIHDRCTPLVWFGNLFFLQEIRVPFFGSNGPLWSLSNEFWYYLLFPAGVIIFASGTVLRVKLGCGVMTLLILIFIGKSMSLYFVIWLLGAFAGRLKLPRVTHGALGLLGSLVLFVGSLLLSRLYAVDNVYAYDFLIAMTFTALVYFILNYPPQVTNKYYKSFARFTASISYTLYLVHAPALVFLNALLVPQSDRWQPGFAHIGFVLSVTFTVLLYTYLVWRFTEAKTNTLRRSMSALLKLRAV